MTNKLASLFSLYVRGEITKLPGLNTSLFFKSVSDEEKKFYKIDTCITLLIIVLANDFELPGLPT
jgi:hypothetical protein